MSETTEKTRALVDRFIEHNEAGRFEDCYRMLNVDGNYTLIGKTEASGVYYGPDDILTRLAPLLSNFTERPRMRVSHILVDGDQAFVRASGKGAGIHGPYEQPYYGFYFRAANEGFSELVEFLDPTELEISLFGKKLVGA
ncbi:hypothetical protein CDQ92_11510 [Sphingopyxis bauzanensis]|uniref:SnoaL-like domain-containing protein n=1 Tax=Sphingopyxis bauzanensis TaxID=651663 RepID=A0A246JSF2_9SPHN|nr:hypothetical protein [Sphingopyxis bauzanensis]OWQ95452.1 hypothetical protein CDQ92_11510 [Sphingopyxis bauzanensis]GGJ53092.1 hypothetical protein GCM10011393_24170 [Sphingopyxis bauzanensis]